jgi:hypothetical protein
MKLEHLLPESVHDFSATVGAWLISEGYGVPEMRSAGRAHTPAPRAQKRRASDRARKRV